MDYVICDAIFRVFNMLIEIAPLFFELPSFTAGPLHVLQIAYRDNEQVWQRACMDQTLVCAQ